MQVYTPPGYSAEKKYPQLYLLHGIGGNEKEEWTRQGVANVVLDNLIADKKIEPMVVVLPTVMRRLVAMLQESAGDEALALVVGGNLSRKI